MVLKILLYRFFFLVTAACFATVTILLAQRYLPRQKILAQETSTSLSDQRLPVKLIIRQLDLVLPVYLANKKNEGWEITDKGVSYLKDSVLPGEAGNSIFYGHNWPNLLGNLVEAKVGQEILIINGLGEIKYFVISKTELINGGDENFIPETSEARLIIYTCAGFFDQNRFIVLANPLE